MTEDPASPPVVCEATGSFADRRHFHEAVSSRCRGFLALEWSEAFLIRLEVDPRWPRWIP